MFLQLELVRMVSGRTLALVCFERLPVEGGCPRALSFARLTDTFPLHICAQNHHDGLGGGHLRQLRPVQLQLGQAGPAGAGQHAGHRGQEIQHPLQHRRSGGRLAPHGDGDAPR